VKSPNQTVVGDDRRDANFGERVALLAVCLGGAGAVELLTGLADGPKASASVLPRIMRASDSATRQARLTHEFGDRRDALRRLEELILDSPPDLRFAIAMELPKTFQVQFPHLLAPSETCPARQSFAARLVREAIRQPR
jgi:hypothetical protein